MGKILYKGMVYLSGNGSTSGYITASTYAILVENYPPEDYSGSLAYVQTTTGAFNPLVTTKKSGWYRSNGTDWVDSTSDIDIELWVSGTTYTLTESVLGSDGHIYRSLISSNTGNNPVSTTGYWERISRTQAEVESIAIPLIIALG